MNLLGYFFLCMCFPIHTNWHLYYPLMVSENPCKYLLVWQSDLNMTRVHLTSNYFWGLSQPVISCLSIRATTTLKQSTSSKGETWKMCQFPACEITFDKLAYYLGKVADMQKPNMMRECSTLSNRGAKLEINYNHLCLWWWQPSHLPERINAFFVVPIDTFIAVNLPIKWTMKWYKD